MLQNMTIYEPEYKQGPEIFFKTKNMKNKLFVIEQDIFSLLAGLARSFLCNKPSGIHGFCYQISGRRKTSRHLLPRFCESIRQGAKKETCEEDGGKRTGTSCCEVDRELADRADPTCEHPR
jgi:hypothetical protein